MHVCMYNICIYIYIPITLCSMVTNVFQYCSMMFPCFSMLSNDFTEFCIAFYYTNADSDETFGKVYLQVSRSFLCSSCSPSNCPPAQLNSPGRPGLLN